MQIYIANIGYNVILIYIDDSKLNINKIFFEEFRVVVYEINIEIVWLDKNIFSFIKAYW